MDNAKTTAEGADTSAPDAEKTDEQVWDEILDEEKATEPADESGEGIEPKPSNDAGEVEPDPDPAPAASEDTGDGTASGDAPSDGMDREALQAQNTRLQHSLDSEIGRQTRNLREIDRLQDQITSAPKKPAPGKDSGDARLKERREKLEAAREEYGDVIGPVLDEVADLRTAMGADKKQRADQDAATLVQQKERYETLVRAEQVTFEKEHSDGFDIIKENHEVFAQWIDDQPRRLRDIYVANRDAITNGMEAALLVTDFKTALLDADAAPAPANPETEKLRTRRQRQLDGAQSIRGAGRQEVSGRPAKDSTDDQGHWDHFKRQDEQQDRERQR